MADTKSRYVRAVGAAKTRPQTDAERSVSSLRRGAGRAEEMQRDLKALRGQIVAQQRWLDDPANATDDLWFQRKEIWNDRWTMLLQGIGNLVGWVAIHLAEAERVPPGPIRDRVRRDTERLLAVEQWIEQSGACELRQYPNDEEPPF